MSEALPNFEGLLREALAPVEPPEDLALRLEETLTSITEMAADELQEWELSAMRDPRNWVRPAAALVAGGGAGGALVRWWGGGAAGAVARSCRDTLLLRRLQRRARGGRAHGARPQPGDAQ